MSLFRGSIRPSAILSDAAIERYLAAIREELTPDPLFRRRLRGEVTNRYVAAYEGPGTEARCRSMGRLGRAVLYASFTLALSATSVLAASQEALPGDLLYPLKRHVEGMRMEVLPAHLHHDLAAYELAERIDELARLTELGDSAHAAAMATVVAEDYEAFLADADEAGLVTDDRYLTVLIALLDRLPEQAHDAVQGVVDRAPSHGDRPSADTDNSAGSKGAGIRAVPNANASGVDGRSATEPTPRATKSPKPEAAPRESRVTRAAAGKAPGSDDPGGAGKEGDH